MTVTGPYVISETVERPVWQVSEQADGTISVAETVAQQSYRVDVANAPGPPGPRGPAGLVMRGQWDAGTAYAVDDAVYRGGSSYWAVAPSTGLPPDTDDGTHWVLLAAQGKPGPVSTVDQIAPDDSGNVNLGLAAVATSGAYSDLTGTPTVVEQISAADGTIAVEGNATAPTVRAVTGTTAGTVAAGDDPRFGSTAPPVWTTPALSNGSVPSGYQPPRYCKDAAGFVHLEGVVTGIPVSSDGTLFRLPTGYRPAAELIAGIAFRGSNGNIGFVPLTVTANGYVFLYTTFSLDYSSSSNIGLGFVFHAEQ